MANPSHRPGPRSPLAVNGTGTAETRVAVGADTAAPGSGRMRGGRCAARAGGSVGVAGHLVAAGADEEVQVGALVGLHDVVDVEALPAAKRLRVGGFGGLGRAPGEQLVGRDVEVEPPAGD